MEFTRINPDVDLTLDNRRLCLFCVRETSPSECGIKLFQLRHLSTFLGLEWRELFDLSQARDESTASKLRRSQLFVPVCEECSSITDKFSHLYEILEEVKVRLNALAQKICGVVKDAGSDYTKTMARVGLVAREKILREQLWTEIVQKGQAKNDIMLPRVNLERIVIPAPAGPIARPDDVQQEEDWDLALDDEHNSAPEVCPVVSPAAVSEVGVNDSSGVVADQDQCSATTQKPIKEMRMAPAASPSQQFEISGTMPAASGDGNIVRVTEQDRIEEKVNATPPPRPIRKSTRPPKRKIVHDPSEDRKSATKVVSGGGAPVSKSRPSVHGPEPNSDLGQPNPAPKLARVRCEQCGLSVAKMKLRRHQNTNRCASLTQDRQKKESRPTSCQCPAENRTGPEPNPDLGKPNPAPKLARVRCNKCGLSVVKMQLSRHQKTNRCASLTQYPPKEESGPTSCQCPAEKALRDSFARSTKVFRCPLACKAQFRDYYWLKLHVLSKHPDHFFRSYRKESVSTQTFKKVITYLLFTNLIVDRNACAVCKKKWETKNLRTRIAAVKCHLVTEHFNLLKEKLEQLQEDPAELDRKLKPFLEKVKGCTATVTKAAQGKRKRVVSTVPVAEAQPKKKPRQALKPTQTHLNLSSTRPLEIENRSSASLQNLEPGDPQLTRMERVQEWVNSGPAEGYAGSNAERD